MRSIDVDFLGRNVVHWEMILILSYEIQSTLLFYACIATKKSNKNFENHEFEFIYLNLANNLWWYLCFDFL